ncbi:hypothetical protein ABIA85_009538 [Bradyrhizobium sp. LA6.10]|uniref:hypothetical protein n=1 Tax=Bradyrhizobium sp. LA6.10 TaxID=3156318 RepID=UPI003396BE1C
MCARLSDASSLGQNFTFRPGGQLAGLLFELGSLLGHSFFKGTGLLHSAALSHGAPLDLLKTNPQLAQPVSVPKIELWVAPGEARVALVLWRPLPLRFAGHLHPFLTKLQPRLLVDLTGRLFGLIQAILRLMQVSDKIKIAHRVQCGGKPKVPNERPQAPP